MIAVAPAILLLTTSFTKIIVVLSLTRNALGLQGVPPNQVLAGLALFLSLFIMGPVVSQVNDAALQPYIAGDMTFSQAFDSAKKPMEDFMLKNTRPEELALMVKVSKEPAPATPADVPLTTLVPAFVLSELRAAFIIGLRHLRAVPRDRHRGLRGPDGGRHDDDAAGHGVPPLQAAPVRHGQRLGPRGHRPRRELPSRPR